MSTVTPYCYPQIDPLQVSLYNQLFQKDPGIAFQLGANQYTLAFGPGQAPVWGPDTLTAQVQMTPDICLAVIPQEALLALLLTEIAPLQVIRTLPEEVRGAALEAALESALDRLDQISKARSTIHRLTDTPPAQPFELALGFTLIRIKDGRSGRGVIVTDQAGLAWIADHWGRLPARRLHPFNHLPLTGQIVVGRTRLRHEQVQDLQPLDIILAEGPGSLQSREIRIVFSAGLTLAGNLVESHRILIQNIITNQEETTTMTTKPSAAPVDKELPVSDIPITLVFEIGQTQTTFGELRHLQPGYTLSLSEPLDMEHPVTIRANGVAVGTGDLVLIDNRLGIRIHTFSEPPPAHSPSTP